MTAGCRTALAAHYRIGVEAAPRRVRLVTLSGDFDLAAREALRHALLEAVRDAESGAVLVDLGQVRLLDAACLGVLIGGMTTAAAAGTGYRVINPRGSVEWVLRATRTLEPLTGVVPSGHAITRPAQLA